MDCDGLPMKRDEVENREATIYVVVYVFYSLSFYVSIFHHDSDVA